VVFDEAHNIDNICIEVMSINFRLGTLEAASRNVVRMQAEISKLKKSNSQRLQEEYQRLVQGLTHSGSLSTADEIPANPLLPADILQQAVPGSLRRADSFVNFLKRLIAHLKKRMSVEHVVQESPLAFLSLLLAEEEMEKKPLQFVSERLRTLLRTLEVTEMQASFFNDILTYFLDGITQDCLNICILGDSARIICRVPLLSSGPRTLKSIFFHPSPINPTLRISHR